jgi:hypothetical protein
MFEQEECLCACNRRPCEGICRETHLFKPREKGKPIALCSAAYTEADERKAMYRKEQDD